MSHHVLRPDHDIVARAHDLALRQTDRVPLDDLFDVRLRQRRRGRQGPAEERPGAQKGRDWARAEVQHRRRCSGRGL